MDALYSTMRRIDGEEKRQSGEEGRRNLNTVSKEAPAKSVLFVTVTPAPQLLHHAVRRWR
jgi:hypothetical protein